MLEKFNVLAGHIAQVLQRMPPRLHAVAVHPGALPADRVRQTPQRGDGDDVAASIPAAAAEGLFRGA